MHNVCSTEGINGDIIQVIDRNMRINPNFYNSIITRPLQNLQEPYTSLLEIYSKPFLQLASVILKSSVNIDTKIMKEQIALTSITDYLTPKQIFERCYDISENKHSVWRIEFYIKKKVSKIPVLYLETFEETEEDSQLKPLSFPVSELSIN